jgi:hypothetical protein
MVPPPAGKAHERAGQERPERLGSLNGEDAVFLSPQDRGRQSHRPQRRLPFASERGPLLQEAEAPRPAGGVQDQAVEDGRRELRELDRDRPAPVVAEEDPRPRRGPDRRQKSLRGAPRRALSREDERAKHDVVGEALGQAAPRRLVLPDGEDRDRQSAVLPTIRRAERW